MCVCVCVTSGQVTLCVYRQSYVHIVLVQYCCSYYEYMNTALSSSRMVLLYPSLLSPVTPAFFVPVYKQQSDSTLNSLSVYLFRCDL